MHTVVTVNAPNVVMPTQAWRMCASMAMTQGSMMSVSPASMHKTEKGHCEETDRSDQQEQ